MATIPVSSNASVSDRESGNATAVTATLLHIEITDPIERFSATRASTEMGKAELEVIGRDSFGLILHYIPPAIQQRTARRSYSKQLADADGYRPPANLSVSNVPGPRTEFTSAGNMVEDFYSVGPLMEGMGLNITVWSYAGHMNFSLLGCMKALPNMHLIADGLQQSLAELQAICGNGTSGISPQGGSL
jgi:diacylglycerol O-acyltransferase